MPSSIRHGPVTPVLYSAVLFGSSSCSSALSSVNCSKATVLFRTHGCRYSFAMEAPRGLTVMASGPSSPSPSCTNEDAANAEIGDSTPTNTNVDTNVDVGEVTSYRHTPSADYDDGLEELYKVMVKFRDSVEYVKGLSSRLVEFNEVLNFQVIDWIGRWMELPLKARLLTRDGVMSLTALAWLCRETTFK
ncbi:hypothetical protein Cgig2_008402 [Carnegiea gigantea]|uniref:Uncharacterized protein n=1 Tax=Carnegiea gigantea TaxID=171969 RepID=A0A9Q1KGW8_9CARY|nr:hypothetical protein Cgig2_008402 [Carnegiea gigantea]